MQPEPLDAKRNPFEIRTPDNDFVFREEWSDEFSQKTARGTLHENQSKYPNFKLVGFEPAQRGTQWAYFCKTWEAQWAYNLGHASTTGDALPVLRYTWIVPRSEYKTDGRGSVPAIPEGQMPTWDGAYTWRFVGERMERLQDYLDGLFVQVVHEYWDTEHPLRSEEIDRGTGRKVTVLRELVAANTVGHAVDNDGFISTFESINEHCGWLTTRKAGGLLGNMVNGKAVRVTHGVRSHYWPKVLGSLTVYPVYSDPRDVYSRIVGYNTARQFKAEEYNDECTITIVETVTTKQPILGGNPDWTASSPDTESPEIPRPTPLLISGIRFDGVELKVFCEDCLRQGFEFYDSGWKEYFPPTEFINWPASRLVSVDVRMEDGAWITECLFVDSPRVGRSSGLDLYQRNTAEPTSVEVRWTPQTASGALHTVRMDVATSNDFTRGFLTGYRNKVVTPGTNSPVDSWTEITGLRRGDVYYVRLTRTAPDGTVTVSNTLVVTGRASPELTWRRAGVDIASGSTVAFGPVEVGQTGRITVSLASIGLITVSELDARLSGDGELVFGHDLPPLSLSPGLTQELEIRFAPTAVGSISATLTVTSDAADSPHTILLTGIGAAAEIAVEQPAGTDWPSGGTLSFGTVTTGSMSKVFKVRNTGNAPMRNLSASIEGAAGEDYNFTTPLDGLDIAAGGFKNFTVRFDPVDSADAFAVRTAQLRITSNDLDENPYLLNLTGNYQNPYAAGAVDWPFNLPVNGTVRCMAWQRDGKLLIGGEFTTVDGSARTYLARLNADGTLDSFAPTLDGDVLAIAIQADGKIVIGGGFTGGIKRLNSDASTDSGFTPSVTGEVRCLSVLSDGKILVGGNITGYLLKLNSDGTAASGFTHEIDGPVNAITLDASGKILVVGEWSDGSSPPPSSSTPPSSTPPSSTPPSSTPPSSTPPSSTPPSSMPPSSTPPSSTPPSSTPPSSTPPSSTPPSSTPPSSTPPSSAPPSSPPPSSTPPSSTPPSSTPPSSSAP